MNHIVKNDFNIDVIRIDLANKPWLVACLCAAWCDTCETYKQAFHALSKLHTDKCFAWVDIEDQAHLVDEIDIENFPTILIQYNDKILFLGTVLPDTQQIHRMLLSLSVDATINNEPTSLLPQEQLPPNNWSLRHQLLK